MREFETGAIRDDDTGKIDPEAALSPLVTERYCEYKMSCRNTPKGIRSDDNWQKGMPLSAYMKSMHRHFLHVWKIHRGWCSDNIQDALCALLFNVQGYLHEILRRKAVVESLDIPIRVIPENERSKQVRSQAGYLHGVEEVIKTRSCDDKPTWGNTTADPNAVNPLDTHTVDVSRGTNNRNVNFNYQNSCGHPGCYITSEHVHESSGCYWVEEGAAQTIADKIANREIFKSDMPTVSGLLANGADSGCRGLSAYHVLVITDDRIGRVVDIRDWRVIAANACHAFNSLSDSIRVLQEWALQLPDVRGARCKDAP